MTLTGISLSPAPGGWQDAPGIAICMLLEARGAGGRGHKPLVVVVRTGLVCLVLGRRTVGIVGCCERLHGRLFACLFRTCICGYSRSTPTKPCILGVVVQLRFAPYDRYTSVMGIRYSAGKWQGPRLPGHLFRTVLTLAFLRYPPPSPVVHYPFFAIPLLFRLSGKPSPRVSSSDPYFTIVYIITLRLVVALTPSKSPSPSSLSISVMPWRVLRLMSMPALTADTRWS